MNVNEIATANFNTFISFFPEAKLTSDQKEVLKFFFSNLLF